MKFNKKSTIALLALALSISSSSAYAKGSLRAKALALTKKAQYYSKKADKSSEPAKTIYKTWARTLEAQEAAMEICDDILKSLASKLPDLSNAGIVVSLNTYSNDKLPDVFSDYPSFPLSLGNKLNNYDNLLDSYSANLRAAKTSIDRYSGALLIGRLDWAADRLAEEKGFMASARSTGEQMSSVMPDILSEIGSIDPGLLDSSITPSDVIATRNEESNGIFSAEAQQVFAAWALTPKEINEIRQSIGSVTDTDIQNYFDGRASITGGQVISDATAACKDCFVPFEFSPEQGFILGVPLFLGLRCLKKKRAKSSSV